MLLIFRYFWDHKNYSSSPLADLKQDDHQGQEYCTLTLQLSELLNKLACSGCSLH